MQRYAQWFRDNEGRGYPGAIVTVYLAGTPNKATIYSAQSVTTVEIANPLVTDTNGFYNFAVANGVYDIQIEASGMPTTVIYNWTASDLTPVAGPIPATNVTVSPAGTIASTNAQLALEELDDDIVALDGDVAALDAAAVHIAGTETVTGAKTFSSPVTITDATDSTSSTSSASIKTSGGISCAKAIYAGSLFSGGSPVLVRSAFDARLSLSNTAGQAITTADQTSKNIVYLVPFGGGQVTVYSSASIWITRAMATYAAVTVPSTTDLPFDLFAYDNAGTLALEATSWSNTTTRATGLTVLNGIYVKSGDNTRRYCGTACTTGVSGRCEDSVLNRYLWNYYNRVGRPIRVYDATASWAYTTATWRQMNGSSANQANFVIGVVEDPVKATNQVSFSNSTASTTAYAQCGIGLNSTSAVATGSRSGVGYEAVSGGAVRIQAEMMSYPALGKNYVAPLELSGAVGTTTWGGGSESGLIGEVLG